MKGSKEKSPRIRKHLNADALYATVRKCFEQIKDSRKGNGSISIPDALMSAFAMFSLKDPSLLAFDKRRNEEPENLHTIYGIGNIPCDTTMREILDEISSQEIRRAFKDVFRQLQRGKALEPFVYMDGYYLLALDGTGYFSSEKLHSESCLEKKSSKTGKITYHLQMLGGAIIHPDFKEVIPLAPEIISKQDGETKNDCERNASKRFCQKTHEDHPHMKFIVTEDALSPNAPHIQELKRHGYRFILSVKPGDHEFLFRCFDQAMQSGKVVEFTIEDPGNHKVIHKFRFCNDLPLNASHQDLKVNILEYWEITNKKTKHFCWVTDFTITRQNAFLIMRGGRVRWKIENETFNTLKNQGYQLEHNFGLGKNYLSMNFVMLMMLAFLVDQVLQLCCALFRSVWKKLGTKRALWERVRHLFHGFKMDSMEMIYRAMLNGFVRLRPIIFNDTS